MKTEFDDQQITQLFNAEADSIPSSPVSTETIVGRGRSLKRRRTALLSAAVIVAASGVGYGSMRLLRQGSDRLAVSQPASSTGNTSTAPSSSAAPASGSAVATSVVSSEGTDIGSEKMTTVFAPMKIPASYRDGFIFINGTESGDVVDPETTSVSFNFSTDGSPGQPIGTEIDVVGSLVGPAVHGETVMLVTHKQSEASTLHLYWSDDLENWTEDVIDTSAANPLTDLSPAMAELVDIQLLPGNLVTNGAAWMTSLQFLISPSDVANQKFGVPETVQAEFGPDGLVIPDFTSDSQRVIPADELGVSKADLAAVDSLDLSALATVVSGRRGESSMQIANPSTAPTWILPFGDGFAGFVDSKRQIVVSRDGGDFSELQLTLEPGEEITTITSLQGDLLVVVSKDDRARGYRVTGDGNAVALGDIPVPEGAQVVPVAVPEPILTATKDGGAANTGDGAESSTTIKTATYEVTLTMSNIDSSGSNIDSSGSEMTFAEATYEVRDLRTGEVVAANSRPFGDWLDGEEVDGKSVVIFTDADGRPDVLIPVSELDAAVEMDPWSDSADSETDSSVADASLVDGSVVDGSVTEGTVADISVTEDGPDFIQLATADGIHWYLTSLGGPSSDESSVPIAVNGNKLLVGTFGEGDPGYAVIDLDTAATATAAAK